LCGSWRVAEDGLMVSESFDAHTAFPHNRIKESDLPTAIGVDRSSAPNGYTMVEVCVVLAVMVVTAGFAFLGIEGILKRVEGDSALNMVVSQLRRGRELAIAQRRNIEIHFTGDNQIELRRIDIPGGNTSLSTVSLEYGVEFLVYNGIPDTPDGFGNAASVDFGTATTMTFLSDGTLVNAQGDPVNGSVFFGLANHPETARAVTIIGGTGRVRGYRWTGQEWVH
jgi:type II secretory pathway pseudopilin PulG